VIVGQLALIDAAVFAGAAFYVNVAEQSPRLNLDDRSLLTEWKPAYKRGFGMQASLAVAGFLLGLLAWRQGNGRVAQPFSFCPSQIRACGFPALGSS
jgi:hypothetical protein